MDIRHTEKLQEKSEEGKEEEKRSKTYRNPVSKSTHDPRNEYLKWIAIGSSKAQYIYILFLILFVRRKMCKTGNYIKPKGF